MVTTERPDDKPQDVDADSFKTMRERHRSEIATARKSENALALMQAEGRAATELRRAKQDLEDREMDTRRRRTRASGFSADAAPVLPDYEGLQSILMAVEEVDLNHRTPALLVDTSGTPVFYAGFTNYVQGKPETGKTWLMMLAARQAIEGNVRNAPGGGRVAYLDFDTQNARQVSRRAADMDSAVFRNPDRFIMPSPSELIADAAKQRALIDWLLAAENPLYSLVVIDSDTSAGAPTDGAQIKPWWDTYVGPWERAGVTVLIGGHVPKNTPDDQVAGYGSLGTQGKRALVSGASITVVEGQKWNTREDGYAVLHADKDRHGELRDVTPNPVAHLVIEHQWGAEPPFLNLTVQPPDVDRATNELADKLYDALCQHPAGVYGQRGVLALIKAKGEAKGLALHTLIQEGRIVLQDVQGKRGKLYVADIFAEGETD